MVSNPIAAALSGEIITTDTPSLNLGASQAGTECERALWYIMRDLRELAKAQERGKKLPPRTLPTRTAMIFELGNLLESMVCDFVKINSTIQIVQVDNPHSKKNLAKKCTLRVSLGGVTISGRPDAFVDVGDGKGWSLAELKSSNDARFKQLQKHGLKDASYQHYVQCQVYMWLLRNVPTRGKYYLLRMAKRSPRMHYIAINKNTCEVYVEQVDYSPALMDGLIANIKAITRDREPPARIDERPTYYRCKICNYASECHAAAAIPT